MNPVAVLLYKSLARTLRNRTALVLTVLVPVAMIYIFGWVFGLYHQGGPSGLPLAVVNQSDHPAAQALVDALKAEKAFRLVTEFAAADGSPRPLTEADVRPMIRGRDVRFALVIPADVIPAGGLGLHLKILANPANDIETQRMSGLLQQALVAAAPDLVVRSLHTEAKRRLGPVADLLAGELGLDRAGGSLKNSAWGAVLSRHVKIETEQLVGQDVTNPLATRIIGGWAVMFLMFELSATATALFGERRSGIFRRLLAGPVTRAHILWSHFLFGVGLGLVQLLAVFSAGCVLYGIDALAHWGHLVVVAAVAAAACTALGLLVAALADTQETALGLATLVIVTMSAVGGAWFPPTLMPPFIQQLSKFTLTYWAVDGFTQVLWAGDGLRQLLPTLGILLGSTAGMMALAIWRFNRGRLFD
ncbi:MAG: ABC transporter permease [Verrucomicrobia bacterium]|nr:ABC transporter permease [Verrucomicrobiota bacterium]